MNFTVIADTHRIQREILQTLLPEFNSGDFLVHLGDGLGDLWELRDGISCPIIEICGNCDLFASAPKDYFLDSPAGKILFTHGDKHYVKGGDLASLSAFARQNDCDYAFFAHTHVSTISTLNGVTMINPGSLTRPRSGLPSYCKVRIQNGALAAKIVTI